MGNKYLTGKQAREFLGLCDRSLYSLRVANKIDFIQDGKTIRYPEDGLIAYFERHRVSANAKSESQVVGAGS